MDYLIGFMLFGSIFTAVYCAGKQFGKLFNRSTAGDRSRRTHIRAKRLLHALVLPLLIALLMSSCMPLTNTSGPGDTSNSGQSLDDLEDNDESEGSHTSLTERLTIETETSDIQPTTIRETSIQESDSDKGSDPAESTQIDGKGDGPTPAVSESLEVHFLDVGQGASVLFRQGEYNMILDGGDRQASSFVVAYLKKLGISQIDVMIATHYDADHINGLVGVLNAFDVDVVYGADYEAKTRVYSSYKSTVKAKADREIVPKIGQSFDLGDMHVSFIAPRQYGHSDVNDDSLSIRLDFGSTSFVIMGDQSANAEQQMLNHGNLDADVFYSSHHGSDGSNSKTLLDAVTPKWTVISVGNNNSYGHPGSNTLNRIQNSGSQLFRTDLQGTIIVKSNGKNYEWSTAPTMIAQPSSTAKPTSTPKPNETTKSTTSPATSAATTTAVAPTVTTNVPVPPPIITDPPPTTAAPTTLAPTTLAPTTTVAPATGMVVPEGTKYILNVDSKKFHYVDCHHAERMNESNRIYSKDNRDTIIEMNYSPCGTCKP